MQEVPFLFKRKTESLAQEAAYFLVLFLILREVMRVQGRDMDMTSCLRLFEAMVGHNKQ